MTTLTCPKCRQRMPDDAIDAGHCPACGFPIDGPLVLDPPRRNSRLVPLTIGAVLLAGAGAAGYALYRSPSKPAPEQQPEVADVAPVLVLPVRYVAPYPHAPKPPEPQAITPGPEPKKDGPRPVGVVMKVDPKIAPTRHFDHPDDTAALPDLNSSDRVVLTGQVRTLRIGSVNGKGEIDASGLVAEEIVLTGDLNGEAVVVLHAPNGKVRLGGYIGGTAKLTVVAPGGEVVLLASSGRITGSAAVTVTAKRLELAGKAFGGARLNATLTTGGVLKFASVEEGAIVTYKRGAATDPPLSVEKGTIRGGGKVLAQ